MIRVAEVSDRLRGKVDPAVIKMLEAIVVEQHTLKQQIVECMFLMGQVAQITNRVLEAAQSHAVFDAKEIAKNIQAIDEKHKLTNSESATDDLAHD